MAKALKNSGKRGIPQKKLKFPGNGHRSVFWPIEIQDRRPGILKHHILKVSISSMNLQ